MHNHIHDIANILTSTGSLLAAIPAINNSNPDIKNTSDEDAKPENAAVWQREPRPGDNFSGIDEAMEFIQEHAHNPAKNRCNEDEGYRWSDLPELHREIKPILKLARTTINQEYVNNSDGVPSIKTTFTHVPTLTSKVFWMTTNLKGIRKNQHLDECQQMGWTITYCRRYALYAALDLQPDDMGDMDGKSRRKGRAPVSPAVAGRQWLPDVGNPDWEAAERRAIAMGAVPYTPEEIEAAKEQKRYFTPLAPHQSEFLNKVIAPLNGDMTGITAVFEDHKAKLFAHVKCGDFTLFDEEDQRRALYWCWVTAAEEFSGLKCRHPDDDGFDDDGVRYEDYDKDDADDVVIVPDASCNIPSEDADDELLRLHECRANRKEALRDGSIPNTSGDPAVDAEGDAAYAKLTEKRKRGGKSSSSTSPGDKPLVMIPESDIPY